MNSIPQCSHKVRVTTRFLPQEGQVSRAGHSRRKIINNKPGRLVKKTSSAQAQVSLRVKAYCRALKKAHVAHKSATQICMIKKIAQARGFLWIAFKSESGMTASFPTHMHPIPARLRDGGNAILHTPSVHRKAFSRDGKGGSSYRWRTRPSLESSTI